MGAMSGHRSSRVLRIAAGGMHIESSTFTPYVSGSDDFIVTRGQQLVDRYPWFDEVGAEVIPLVHAGALPGGPVDRAFFDDWLAEFEELLRAATLEDIDGLLLDIHGAMTVQGLDDAEGLIASRSREIVGSDVLISASMDLHGNVSELFFDACDLMTCYRTAPHIDRAETRRRAGLNLARAIRSGEPIYKARVAVPILLSGEQTSTVVEPGKSLYEAIIPATEPEGVWDAAIWMGFPWADQPRCHGAVVACGTDREQVVAAAESLGQRFWGHVRDFDFVGPAASAHDAITEAYASGVGPFFVSDTGDNPGAGGSGDTVGLLEQMAARYPAEAAGQRVLFTSVYDPHVVQVAHSAGLRGVFRAELGAKVGPEFRDDKPFEGLFRVESLFDSAYGGCCALLRVLFDDDETRGEELGDTLDDDAQVEFAPNLRDEFGAELAPDLDEPEGAPVSTGPGLYVVVTGARTQFATEEAFDLAGCPFAGQDVIAVKIGYLEPDLAHAAAGWVMALTPGAVDQDLKRMGHQHVARPLFPFDQPDFEANLSPLVGCSDVN